MPLGYGTSFKPQQLSSNRVGVVPELESTVNFSLISWLLTGIEIALALVPGVGPIAATGIAAVGTGAQLGIEYAETGQVSPLSIGLGVGGTLLPGFIHGVTTTAKAASTVSKFNALTRSTKEPIAMTAVDFTEAFVKDGAGLFEKAKVIRGIDWDFQIKNNVFDLIGGLSDPFDTFPVGTVKAIEETITEAEKLIGIGARGAIAGTEGGIKGKLSYEEGQRKLLAGLTKRYGLTAREINALSKLIVNGEIVNLKAWFGILRRSFTRTGNKVLSKMLSRGARSQYNLLFQSLKKGETLSMFASRMLHKTISTSTKIMGWVASPSSLVGEIVSKTLGKISAKWEKLGEKLGERIKYLVSRGAKSAKQLEEEFERTGGRLFKSSWLMGYKPLNVEGVMNTIMIQFKPGPSHNKKPVVATLTDIQLKTFTSAPSKGKWYLDNIAHARNGHPYNTVIDGIDLMEYLGFLPVAEISEVLSVVSASKALTSSLNAKTSIFSSQYWSGGMPKAFLSAAITEAGKIVGNTFVAGGEIVKTTVEDSIKSVIQGQTMITSFSQGFKGAFSQDAKRRFEASGGRNINQLRSKVEPLRGIKGAFQ